MSSAFENDLMITEPNVRAIKFRSLNDDDNNVRPVADSVGGDRQHNVKHPTGYRATTQVAALPGAPANKCPDDDRKSAEHKRCSRSEDASIDQTTELRQRRMLRQCKQPAPAVRFDRVCFEVSASQQQNSTSNPIGRILNQVIPSFDCIRTASNDNNQSPQLIQILKSIKLEVPQGCIFGLLGPSSCGKTTLLRCLVGLLRPSSGSIELFGRKLNKQGKLPSSNHNNHGAYSGDDNTDDEDIGLTGSGPAFGYMPQDLALYEDFTIRQLLTMFGRYTGMATGLIETRLEFMAKFLDLPEVDREISSLSGGQKRRVSFAIACLHMPPLIILDEPTVGVDPLLRQSIWRYLRELARDQGRTIIITTHYIEEAAQADQVALMRAGEILIQDAPKRIMEHHNCATLEEAFLQICNNVVSEAAASKRKQQQQHSLPVHHTPNKQLLEKTEVYNDMIVRKQDEVARFNKNQMEDDKNARDCRTKLIGNWPLATKDDDKRPNRKRIHPSNLASAFTTKKKSNKFTINNELNDRMDADQIRGNDRNPSPTPFNQFHGGPFEISDSQLRHQSTTTSTEQLCNQEKFRSDKFKPTGSGRRRSFRERLRVKGTLLYALFYKNYRRNMNSIPLIAFQFMLPIIQMISFSLCVGGRPSNVGLGLVNHDSLEQFENLKRFVASTTATNTTTITNDTLGSEDYVTIGDSEPQELLSKKYLSFIDKSVLNIREYPNLKMALNDVRRAKLWAAIEFGENFTTTLLTRMDPDNFYTLERETVAQSVIKLYPDKSNKILDMICMRILVNSFREFLGDQFEHLKQLPIQVKEVIFDIKPNLISNSLDGYTESIAAGLLASLTYIMAAGLTTFIMVVERGKGILERTYTSGVNPVLYLMAHAIFRSLVMMVQIGLVMFLTFYLLKQPLVGSLGLAYLMLMTLNVTGISYGLLVSSLVQDQNGAALTIVSSLVVKITLSGILWPLEAIPLWLRTICIAQPLTLPIQALKQITLKGATIEHRSVQLGFLVSIGWTCLFLFIAARRFKFYQH